MASGNVIDVVVVASTAQAEASLKRVGATAEGSLGASGPLGKASKEAESGLSKAGKGAGNFLTGLTGLSPAMLGAAAIGGGLALAADGVFKAFEANQKATLNLEVEMKNAGEKVTPQFTKALQAAQHAGENLGFAQSDTTKTMGALTLAGLTTAQAFKQLPVIMDLARTKNIDVATATEMYVKGIAGAGRGLKDLNIIGLMTLPTTAAISAAHVKLAADTKKYGASSVQARADQEKLNTTLNIAAVRAHNLTVMHDELSKKVGGAATNATKSLGVEWGIVTAKFNDFAGQAIPVVEQGIAALLGVLVPAITWMFTYIVPVMVAIGKVMIQVINVVVHIWITEITILVNIIKGVVTVVQWVVTTVAKVLGGITSAFKTVFGGIAAIIGGVAGGVASAVKGIINTVIGVLNFFIGVIDTVIKGMNAVLGAIPTFGAGKIQIGTIGKIASLAEGGIVMPTPGGSLVRVAEGGRPEAVIPLPSNLAKGHGGDTYNISTNVASPADPNAISRAVVFSLRSRSRASLAIA
jgi:hypothetical protein